MAFVFQKTDHCFSDFEKIDTDSQEKVLFKF